MPRVHDILVGSASSGAASLPMRLHHGDRRGILRVLVSSCALIGRRSQVDGKATPEGSRALGRGGMAAALAGSGCKAERSLEMSLHSSLKGSTKIRAKRNVLKRFERVNILTDEGRYSPGQKVWGLPKTKVPA